MSELSLRGTLAVSFGEVCDRGKVREENQDSVRSASIPLGELFIVADGIGGYQGGATASRMVVEGFHSQLAARPANYPPDHALIEACTYTNTSIHNAAMSGDPSLQRMGSTVVLALIQTVGNSGPEAKGPEARGPEAWIGHVGDSRAYLIRNGQMRKLTSDHSAVQALLSRNLITEEEARNHPDASVLTRSLGHRPEVEIEIDRVALQAGDALLLCSDGLWGYVADADIAAVATDSSLSVQTIADTLLHQALAAGGQDNIGIEYIRMEGSLASTLVQAPAAPQVFPRSAAEAPPDAEESAARKGRYRQQLLAVGLLLLAGCGYFGYALHGHHWPFGSSQSGGGNVQNSGGSGANQAQAAGDPNQKSGAGRENGHGQQKGGQDAGGSGQPPRPADRDKKILIVGDPSSSGPAGYLPNGAIRWKRIVLARESVQKTCALLAQDKPVVFSRRAEDWKEAQRLDPWINKHAKGIRSYPIDGNIDVECGPEKYDVILVFPNKALVKDNAPSDEPTVPVINDSKDHSDHSKPAQQQQKPQEQE